MVAEDPESQEEVEKLLSLDKKLLDRSDLSLITKLDVSGCDLASFPPALVSLTNLSILFASNNRFETVPSVVGRCPKLQMVAFKSNKIARIEDEALQPQMRWLILTNNQITELPETIGRCKFLQKLMLSGNCIKRLPDSIENLESLELVRLASNLLETSPTKLLELPKLAWVALSDNPFLSEIEDTTLKILDIAEDGEVLGQGAGGVTRKQNYEGTPVAVKVFGSSMTSDGKPSSEKSLVSKTSTFQSKIFVQVLGQTQAGSLVMEFLENYSVLAGPPSLESCTRDVYNMSTKFTWDTISQWVSDLLAGLAELHAAGVCHGDLYGHNILVREETLKLTDFGAAFSYPPSLPIERIEVRAFQVLVQELAAIVSDSDNSILATLGSANLESFQELEIKWKQLKLKELGSKFGVDDI